MPTEDIFDLSEPDQSLEILHVFADRGVEAEVLSKYGSVTRVTINPTSYDHSTVIKADARNMPLSKDMNFDLGVFHPPCTKWSDMPDANKDGSAPNLIPLSREIADTYCDEYIIENKPSAPLKEPTVLTGKMFGIPLKYDRAFETSFELGPTPPEQDMETAISPYFYSDRSKQWWASVKQVPSYYPKGHIAKNALPAPYTEFLMRRFLEQHNYRDADNARSNHSDDKPLRLSR